MISPGCRISPTSSQTDTVMEPVLSATRHALTTCASFVFVAFPTRNGREFSDQIKQGACVTTGKAYRLPKLWINSVSFLCRAEYLWCLWNALCHPPWKFSCYSTVCRSNHRSRFIKAPWWRHWHVSKYIGKDSWIKDIGFNR